MSRTERGFGRDWHWSVFHRSMPPPARMIDIDTLEYCPHCGELIFVLEAARDIGQSSKPATLVCKVAKEANIMAFLLFYKAELIEEHVYAFLTQNGKTELSTKLKNTGQIPSLSPTELAILWRSLQTETFKIFRVKQLYPVSTPYRHFTPQEFYDFISQLHREHEAACPKLIQGLFAGAGAYNKVT